MSPMSSAHGKPVEINSKLEKEDEFKQDSEVEDDEQDEKKAGIEAMIAEATRQRLERL